MFTGVLILKICPVNLHFGENFVESDPFVFRGTFKLLVVDLRIVLKGKHSIV